MTNHSDPISYLIHSTVRILCIDKDGEQSSGTGYIFNFCEHEGNAIPCVITNKHVINGAVRGVFHLTLRKEDGSPDLGNHEQIVVEGLEKLCLHHPNPAIDLAALPIGAILNSASKSGKNYYYVHIGKQLLPTEELLHALSPMEQIVMIGYPNGIWDQAHNLPIIRRGITATHARLNLNGKPEFLIDAACFPGSSGSPVFLANIGNYVGADGSINLGTRIALLGTLYAGPQHTTTGDVIVVEVPTDTKAVAVGSIPNNLGYVISSTELQALEELTKSISETPMSRNAHCRCGSGKRFKHCCGLSG